MVFGIFDFGVYTMNPRYIKPSSKDIKPKLLIKKKFTNNSKFNRHSKVREPKRILLKNLK